MVVMVKSECTLSTGTINYMDYDHWRTNVTPNLTVMLPFFIVTYRGSFIVLMHCSSI